MTTTTESTSSGRRCHYDILGVELDADATSIKKAHRKLALKLHPDKNNGATTEEFRLVQQAYETLSDPAERQWYDEHRQAILQGWTVGDTETDIVFDVVPFMHAGCYTSFDDDDSNSFYQVYQRVFRDIVANEGTSEYPTEFGNSKTEWETDLALFYRSWENFATSLSFAWADPFHTQEAPNRRVKRAMEDENKKARKTSRKLHNQNILALVKFIKKRDPRVKRAHRKMEHEKEQKAKQRKEQDMLRKIESMQIRDELQKEAEEHLAAMEEDDLAAGRIRLADLDDDYDYGGKKGKRGKKKQTAESDASSSDSEESINGEPEDEEASELQQDSVEGSTEDLLQEEELYSSSEESNETPDIWRCECCRKDFKSEGQMENHMKSKKHKEAHKKFQAAARAE